MLGLALLIIFCIVLGITIGATLILAGADRATRKVEED